MSATARTNVRAVFLYIRKPPRTLCARRVLVGLPSGVVDQGVVGVPPADIDRFGDESAPARDDDQRIVAEALDEDLGIRDLRSALDAIMQVRGYEAQVELSFSILDRPAFPDRRRIDVFEEDRPEQRDVRQRPVNEDDGEDHDRAPEGQVHQRIDRRHVRCHEGPDGGNDERRHQEEQRQNGATVVLVEEERHDLRECVEDRPDDAEDPDTALVDHLALVLHSETRVHDGNVVRRQQTCKRQGGCSTQVESPVLRLQYSSISPSGTCNRPPVTSKTKYATVAELWQTLES